MRLNRWLCAALLVSSTSAIGQPTPAASIAQDVAEVSTNVCFRLTSGELRWMPQNLEEEIAQVEAAGLSYGVPGVVIETLGRAGQAMVNRATIAHRANGGLHLILAKDGSIPGCRVMLAGDAAPGMTENVATALGSAGWLALDALTETRGPIERRLFLRFDSENQVYILNLMTVSDPSTRLRLFTSVARVPDSVALPPGIRRPVRRP